MHKSIMAQNLIRLTVLFEEPFWVGVFEKSSSAGYSVARTIFGKEPTNPELYEFLLKNSHKIAFGISFDNSDKIKEIKNPKRRQRAAQKELINHNTVSKAHDAIKKMIEASKEVKKTNKSIRENCRKDRMFSLKQMQKKEKHKGH